MPFVLRMAWLSALVLGVISAGFTVAAQTAPDGQSRANAGTKGVILSLNGPVTPATAQYLEREIENADEADADLIVMEIDTPGGLVDSMKTIIKAILSSETPVATFVSPQGARSASAGLYIMYGSHIAAMAPYTNTGAATPVEIGGQPSRDNPFEGENPFPAPTNPATENEPAEAAPSAGDGDEDETIDGPASVLETTQSESTQDDSTAETATPATAAPDAGDRTQPVAAPSSADALRAKVVNDSVAYIRALAEGRGRNADWAEEAVRDGVSITANEALEIGVIELIAEDLQDLLDQLDGRTVDTIAGPKTLSTSNIQLTRVDASLAEQILGFLANPNVAAILLTLGTTGLIAEIWNPGSIFPGILGVVCLLLAFYSFQVLPFNQLGIGLMVVGLVLMTLEAYTPTFGIAGLVGLLSFAGGLYVVFPEGFQISPFVIGSLIVSVGLLLGMILVAIVGSRNHGPLIGGDAIRKREGIVDEWEGGEGWVIVEGERWRARSDKPLQPGDKIRVVDVDGLVLIVRPLKAGGLLGGLTPTAA
ncbi:MAG: nodulation protein NfeD [Pseudomonadota bacterium]